MTTTLFDWAESTARKHEGMALAAAAHAEPLKFARKVARVIAIANGMRCDADQVRAVLDEHGITGGNWLGSLFKGGEWIFTGERKQSARVTAHAREIKVWQLVS